MESIVRAGILSLSAILLVSGCGGGGGGSGGSGGTSNASLTAPSNLSYSSPQVLIVSQSMPAMSPTVSGTVSTYSVNPALPAGLAIDTTTGVISGTPTAPAAAATYTVTAANSGGITTASISITVHDVVPSFVYDATDYTLTTGVPVNVAPIQSGGAVTAWSISPALPAGLTFSATDGTITGTPTEAGSASDYVVTAQNDSGSDTFELSFAVDSGVLVDLGHTWQVVGIRRQGNRVLSIDSRGHWVLWNSATTANLAQGDVPCVDAMCNDYVDLAGSTVGVRVEDGLHVRDAEDGSILAIIDEDDVRWWKLASDGSYVSAGTTTEVAAWNRSGTLLFSQQGNYLSGRAFAAPSELRIAAGAAGADRLETITITNAASTSVQFQGQFHSWFVDGDRFLTNVSTTVWVYDQDGTQQDLRVLPSVENLTGQGEWFWTARRNPYVLSIYDVGASATPAASYNLPSGYTALASGNTIGIVAGADDFSIVDLSGGTPVKTDHDSPLIYSTAYAAISNTQWLAGDRWGVLAIATDAPSTPTYLAWGTAFSIATSPERIAVATGSGNILYFDAATRELEGTIEFPATELELSADGTVLAALANTELVQSLRIFSLPSENVLRDEPHTAITTPLSISLSASGAVYGKTAATGPSAPLARQVARVSDGVVLWSDTLSTSATNELPPLRLSASGAHVAASNGGFWPTTGTNIYVNGVLSTAVQGLALGWVDENRLLVNQVVWGSRGYPDHGGTLIVTPTGQQSAVLPLPYMTSMQPMPLERIYSPELNVIVSLTDAATLWSSANPTRREGGVTATHVIFASGAAVRAEPF